MKYFWPTLTIASVITMAVLMIKPFFEKYEEEETKDPWWYEEEK